MRIVYGVHGYGRGHATRSSLVINWLRQEGHEVLIYAGGDAYKYFSSVKSSGLHEIPYLKLLYGNSQKISSYKTVKDALQILKSIWLSDQHYEDLGLKVKAFEPELFITDSEIYTSWLAKDLGVPLICLDNYGSVIAAERDLPPSMQLSLLTQKPIYYLLTYNASLRISASFYSPTKTSVEIINIPTLIREQARTHFPVNTGFVLVYIGGGMCLHADDLIHWLKSFNYPAIIYGLGSQAKKSNIIFKEISPNSFLEDLSLCSAVISTAGNQLISECLFYDKPFLIMPEDSLEQKVNTFFVEKYSLGLTSTWKKFKKLSLNDLIYYDRRLPLPKEVRVDGFTELKNILKTKLKNNDSKRLY